MRAGDTNPPEVAEIVLQRLIEMSFEIKSSRKVPKRGRNHRMKDDPAAGFEKMSLSELAAHEADVIQQVAAGTIAPQEPNAISDEAEKRVRALNRELSSH